MTTQEQIDMIVDYLEKWYCGARAMDDIEIMVRVERALAVIKMPASEDAFLPEFVDKYMERQVAEALKDVYKS